MKKIVAFILILLSSGTIPLVAHDRSHGHEARSESPEPSCRSCGLWRVLFSCCCGEAGVEASLVVIDIIHAALEATLLTTPGAIREIYLLCQNAAYALSKAAVHTLNAQGFLDAKGNLKPGWREHILQLLAHDGTAANADEFYFLQRIEDLTKRHSDIAAQFKLSQSSGNPFLTLPMIQVLHDQYNLTASREEITGPEFDAILKVITQQTAQDHATVRTPLVAKSHFRVRSVAEATSRGYLTNSVIIHG